MSETVQNRVHRWGRFEAALELRAGGWADPLRDVQVEGHFIAPGGRTRRAPGFWDGGATWRVRFAPDEPGLWRYALIARVAGGELVRTEGGLECVPYTGTNPLYRHGPPRMAAGRRRLAHADGAPFFWLADTVWNGALLSTSQEWELYIATRRAQGFTSAQFVSTQWRTAPDGGPDGPAYTGGRRLEAVRPQFFRRLDVRIDALAEAGLVAAPVLLWAISRGENAEYNPGHVLSDEDAALLARYQVARWQAHPVVWILNGDGTYTGEHAERWRRIGRAVFPPGEERAPVATHPGGRQWVGDEFRDELWLDIVGYQSGHGDDEATWRWLVEGPPTQRWREVPEKAVINLEPCYEGHLAYHSRQPHSPQNVRRACYWSLLVIPTAGVTYGGHGVWGWDDGTRPPVAHPNTGIPLPWQQALRMPGAEQMRYLSAFFQSLAWWTLWPDQSLVREQPGVHDVLRFIAAARSEDGRLAVLYVPAGGPVHLNAARLALPLQVVWTNPRDGSRQAGPVVSSQEATLMAPDEQDWLLVLAAGS